MKKEIVLGLLLLVFLLVGLPFLTVGVLWVFGYSVSFWAAFTAMFMQLLSITLIGRLLGEHVE